MRDQIGLEMDISDNRANLLLLMSELINGDKIDEEWDLEKEKSILSQLKELDKLYNQLREINKDSDYLRR